MPPLDPEGEQTLYPDFLTTPNEIKGLLNNYLNKLLDYLFIQKTTYSKKVRREGKDLIDKNVDELDDNLRK